MSISNIQSEGLESLINKSKLNDEDFEEILRLIYGKRLPCVRVEISKCRSNFQTIVDQQSIVGPRKGTEFRHQRLFN